MASRRGPKQFSNQQLLRKILEIIWAWILQNSNAMIRTSTEGVYGVLTYPVESLQQHRESEGGSRSGRPGGADRRLPQG